MNTHRTPSASRNIVTLALSCALVACGGGGGGGSFNSSSGGSSSSGGPPTTAQRIAAADTTAASATNGCHGINPFYWEIGDATAMLTGRTEPTSAASPLASTPLTLLSASKWLFAAYVVQQRGGGSLSQDDQRALTMSSGYVDMTNGSCLASQSVGECNSNSNGPQVAGEIDHFHYSSGHFQHLGATGGFGIESSGTAALKTSMDAYLPGGLTYTWDTPELAGGARDSAEDYAKFLREILDGTLLMKDALGQYKVATDATLTSASSIPGDPFASESVHYSLGHWVEDDPSGAGDGAYSSPGFYGFYPWIYIDPANATNAWYGIVARDVVTGNADAFRDSIVCGRLIRRAWLTGVVQ